MISKSPLATKPIDYEKEAQAYLESLPLEHFMESTAQATQRQITVVSLELLARRRADVQVFSELLVQYPREGQHRLGQVVPDNMVVLSAEPIRANTSFNLPQEPAAPFWVLEYISKSNKRKDYKDSRAKYERDLKVPYYLIFEPANQKLKLYHHNQLQYEEVKPNNDGRYRIAELDLEVGLHDGWVRYWYQGAMLPLPADLEDQLDTALRQAEDAKRQAKYAKRQADDAKLQAEDAKRQAEDATRLAGDLQQRLEAAERELARIRARQ